MEIVEQSGLDQQRLMPAIESTNETLMQNMEKVLPLLKVWVEELRRLSSLEQLRAAMSSLLVERIARRQQSEQIPSHEQIPSLSPLRLHDSQIINFVRELIETEQTLLDSKTAYANTDAYIKVSFQ